MSALTQNTVNFCRHHAPFRTQQPQQIGLGTVHKPQVRDKQGMIVATCERIDDAWMIAEALNAVVEFSATKQQQPNQATKK